MPHAHARLRNPIEKCDQLIAHVADAVATGKRGGMEKNTGGAIGIARGAVGVSVHRLSLSLVGVGAVSGTAIAEGSGRHGWGHG